MLNFITIWKKRDVGTCSMDYFSRGKLRRFFSVNNWCCAEFVLDSQPTESCCPRSNALSCCRATLLKARPSGDIYRGGRATPSRTSTRRARCYLRTTSCRRRSIDDDLRMPQGGGTWKRASRRLRRGCGPQRRLATLTDNAITSLCAI